MSVDDQAKLAYASVSDLTKQLITLGTGVVTLEVTFAKAFVEKMLAKSSLLQTSWVFLMLSIVVGIWVLMALTGSLAKNSPPASADIYKPNIRLPAFIQLVLFVLGMVFTIAFGFEVGKVP